MGLSCFGATKRCRRKTTHSNSKGKHEGYTTSVSLFSYSVLKAATKNFHPSNKLGGGGFGVVYKGVLKDETVIAVKPLSAESEQGTHEFLTEIDTISNVRHPNLVQLIGCCLEGSNRILVYEYMENNSLALALFGPKSKKIAMDWPTRAAICLGTAQGLAFLHEENNPHIVHRDIKASNILLDEHLNPKIGDFGLAKLFPDNVTHVSTRVAGTMGYLAPEYALLGQLTKKADVYSFGVLILELVSGCSSSKSAWGEDMLLLVDWTWRLREENRLLDIVDQELIEFPENEVTRFIKVAIFCTQATASQRPTMKQVVRMLTKNNLNFHEHGLTQPGVCRSNNNISVYSGSGSSQENSSIPPISSVISSVQNGPNVSMVDVVPR